MTEPARPSLFKIGEVARESGVGVETLRFYESRGLVAPASRTQSGYRLYDPSVHERLSFIKKAQSAGFRLDEISRLISEAAVGSRPCAEVRQLASERLAELEERVAELTRYRDELRATVAAWGAASEKDGIVCGLIEGLVPEGPRPAAKAGLKS